MLVNFRTYNNYFFRCYVDVVPGDKNVDTAQPKARVIKQMILNIFFVFFLGFFFYFI